MNEPDFAAVLQERRGTLIEEWFSNKGPVRYWWTCDDVPAASPFKWTAFGVEAVFGREYDDFSLWVRKTYIENTNTQLVSCSYVPEMISPRKDKETAIPIPVVAVYSGKLSRVAAA